MVIKMNEEKETITLTESELELVASLVRMAREVYRVAHGARAFCSTHDNVERKARQALDRIEKRHGQHSSGEARG